MNLDFDTGVTAFRAEVAAWLAEHVQAHVFPEFDLENAHYGLFQGIGEVDFA